MHAGDLEARLADLRDAMYQASYARNDPARQRRFLTSLFESTGDSDASFISVVEARGYEDEPRFAARPAEPGGWWTALRKRRYLIGAVAAGVVLVVAACSLLIHSVKSDSVAAMTGFPAKLRVGLLDVVDTAPFYRAVDQGYFRDEKLDVEIVKVRGGPDAVRELADGRIDIAFTSYPGAFTAQAQHIADLRIAAAAYTARNSHLMLMGPADGSFTHGYQAPGKRIAVTATGSISDIGTSLALREANVDPKSISWVSLSMDDMIGALSRGDVDGAVMAEPYVTRAERLGAIPVLDVTLGRTAFLPLSGWFVTADQVRAYPEAVQAFQRALARGTADVQRRDERDSVLVKYLGVDPAYVDDVRIATYPLEVDVSELRKVVDLMRNNGFLAAPVDVGRMLIHWPNG
ncbi:ABC transporter substrate-binding protein [Amycolatopsis sp. OK19-0408]|uniref:ABC transporter substrate-binding protein n=1 Tax=Amycolatopsis iheyensis TaxID=2945988 RepID=A0A9X2NML7_9PSEU|nr:ABC transporter substrate-binding protein [Amycolatopsis iheyensis]MCR6490752.1 ABC transporter substrate-binding protein [Amycolatopsis iheyensis]